MKPWLKRAVVAGGLLSLGGALLSASGIISITASSGHWAVTEWFLRFSMRRSIATHSLGIKVPQNLSDPALVQKGAGHYEIGCRSCHGEPERPRPRIAAHMLPMPPDLAPRILESNPKKLFYVVKHGLKFTGMPAWPSPQRDDEVWAMVAFLLEYPQLDNAAYLRLVARDELPSKPDEELNAPAVRHAALQSCARCHGVDGLSRHNPTLPRLAGQRGAYLRGALEAYADDRRHSGIMGPVAAALTFDAIEEVVAYYAGLPASPRGPAIPSAARTPEIRDSVARGETIALHGIREQRVPACVECHAPNARRARAEYPLLAGQPAAYLELQLKLFRDDHRGGSEYAHLMNPIASRLTPEQARDVAHYFASLQPADSSR